MKKYFQNIRIPKVNLNKIKETILTRGATLVGVAKKPIGNALASQVARLGLMAVGAVVLWVFSALYLNPPVKFRIEGFVKTEEFLKPVPEAMVSVENTSLSAMTDSTGFFELIIPMRLKDESVTLHCYKRGYNSPPSKTINKPLDPEMIFPATEFHLEPDWDSDLFTSSDQ